MHVSGVHPLFLVILLGAISLAVKSRSVFAEGKATVSACAVVCDFSRRVECVPTFACESKRGPFVGEVENRNEKRLGDKIYGGSFAGYFSSADSEGSQRTGKCMYIKARWNKRYSAGSTRPRCGRGREGPCFGVQAVVCDPSPKAECVPTFTRESERGPFVREVENRDEKWFETALWR